MDQNNKTPQVRFKGYTDTWEQRKLGECFSERVESMPDGELISVTINDGIKKFSELGRHDNSNDNKSKYKKVCVGDIAYNSMRMWQGASGYSPYEGIVSPAYTVLMPNAGVFSRCIAYQFKLPQMIHTFQINSQGITSDNWNLKYPTLSEIEIYISKNVAEQKQIAEFFTSLDNLITLHQRKYNKLLNLKKAMLEKMFPQNGSLYPEIRFKGFTDAWEQRKLGEYVSIISGEAPSKFEDGTKLYVKVDDLNYNDKYVVDTQNKVAEHSTVKRVTKGSVIFPKRGAAIMTNKVRIVGIDSYIDTNMMALTSEKLDSEFLYNIISKEGLYKIADTSTIPQINNKHIEPYEVTIPSLDEQRRIGAYFCNLDNLITLHQRKLEKLKNIKKSCLEKMFV